MGTLTKHSGYWGNIPATIGNVYWVAPALSYYVDGEQYESSDNNDGLSPQKALRRVERAWNLVTANQGDIIVLLPGTHSSATQFTSTAASVAADIAGVTMMGLPCGKGNPYYKRTLLTVAAADQTVNVTAADIEIANITFLGDVLNVGSAHLDFSSAANRLHIHDCSVDFTAQTANTGILGFDALGAAAKVVIEKCVFHCDGAFGPAVDLTATVDSILQDCIFSLSAGTWALVVTTGAATDTCVIRRNQFNSGAGTMVSCIDGTGATIANGVMCNDNYFGVLTTVRIEAFDAAEATISQNFVATVGGGTGGTLIVVIT